MKSGKNEENDFISVLSNLSASPGPLHSNPTFQSQIMDEDCQVMHTIGKVNLRCLCECRVKNKFSEDTVDEASEPHLTLKVKAHGLS